MSEQDEKKRTMAERLSRIEKVLLNEIWHELRWHRRILVIILGAIIVAGIANIFT